MQSIIHHQFGEPVDVLALGDMPQPEPKAGEQDHYVSYA